MKTINLNEINLVELTNEELINSEGGLVFGFNWGAFWRGVGIGVGVGATAAAYYA